MPDPRPRRPALGDATAAGTTDARPDPYARLAAVILAGAKTAGGWTPPWRGASPFPRNALTGARYSGVNILALWVAAQAADYPDPRWATYRQWAALGAQVRRGERGTAVLFYRDFGVDPDAGSDRDGAGEEAEAARRFVARASTVFNAAQVDGAPDLARDPAPPAGAPIPEAAALIDALAAAAGARVAVGGARACYAPAADLIRVPPPQAFRSGEAYAGTLAHELVHWTAAPQRLARDLTGRFGTRAYAVEELVAELGAAFVLADLGLARTPHPDHAAYVGHWLPLLRAEPRALAHAASQAARAAAYLAERYAGAGAGSATDGPGPSSAAGPVEAGTVRSAA